MWICNGLIWRVFVYPTSLFLLFGVSTTRAMATEPFELREGDRVVFLGGTFVERERKFGSIETALTAQFANCAVTFRNLGWSGDTVWCNARERFSPPSPGFVKLKEELDTIKPTVVFVSYGLNESFEGKSGLASFERGLSRLFDTLDAMKTQVVVITPRRLEKLPPPSPDPGVANERLADYATLLRSLAESRRYRLIDLFNQFVPDPKKRLTENGIYLTAPGYLEVSRVVLQELGRDPDIVIGRGPRISSEAYERLRVAIVAKNELFFHRWRPQNELFLSGPLRDEQPTLNRELKKLDPLVIKKEGEIAVLRASLAHANAPTSTEGGR